jgi:tetratricopeptide (TPR) repeat protein
MSDNSIEALRAEFERVESALREPMTSPQRTELKGAIVQLFRRTDLALEELAAFKEGIRALVDGFKALPTGQTTPSVRHDHIGASTHIERGWSAMAGGDWAGAQAELQRAIGLDATSTVAPALMGWALMYENRNDEALQLCLQVLLRDPEQGLARVAVGAICLRKGIVGEAIEHLSRALARTSDARATLYGTFWLGVAYLERDMPADAIEFLRRAVTLGPNLAEGWAELGRALWLRGQPAEAREAWTVGAGIRHSPHARRCADLIAIVSTGGTPPRSAFA